MLNRGDADGQDGFPVTRADAVLIVEDDGLISLMLEDLAREAGAAQVHVCRDLGEGLAIARDAPLTYAILDVAMHGGGRSYDIADVLAARGIPFFFCTGMSREDIELRHRDRPLLAKPYGDRDFETVLAALLRR